MKRVKCDRETALLNPSLIQPETRKYKLFWSIAGNWSTCEPFNLLFGSRSHSKNHTAASRVRGADFDRYFDRRPSCIRTAVQFLERISTSIFIC
jgi:hypothetical protein